MSSENSTKASATPSPKRSTPTKDTPYVFTVGGDAGPYGGPHEAGDVVPSSAPSHKLSEWTEAGVIKRANPPRKDK